MSREPLKPASEVAVTALGAFSQYAPELHRYITRRMRDTANAQDLMQQIFERFLQVTESGHVRNPQSYLYTVASNLVREYHEREGRNPVTFDSEALDAAAEQGACSTDEDLAERLALQQELGRALLKLPPMHRAVLLLVKREGLSYKEVAVKLGLEVSTVTKYVFEARATVKMLLEQPAGQEGLRP